MRLFQSQNKRSVRLIVFTGESNSGGRALNSDATAPELASRSSVLIWNNTTSVFENLDVGTNNLLGHTGLTGTPETTEHSWELGLANIVDGVGGVQRLVKTGQGGSVIADWNTSGTYYTTLTARVNAAIAAGASPNIVFWYTHGINDRIAGTSAATFKSGVQAHIANLKASYPGSKFIMIKNMTNNGNDVYNVKIDEIDAADPDVVSIDCSTSVQADGNHWTYAGQKINATNFYNAMTSNGW